MMVDESKVEQGFDIRYHQWTLRVTNTCPTKFQLLHADKLLYQGQLELENNGELLDISQAQWKFRHRPERIEQWCQLNHGDNLSINMNYYFHEKAVVIEYLARNSIPTRLDIRHAIVPLESVSDIGKQTSTGPTETDWHLCRHGLPSDSIRHSIKPDLFREAFSATQWIVLDKM